MAEKYITPENLAHYDSVSRAVSDELYVPKGGGVVISTSKVGKTATITITDDNVDHSISVSDGVDGSDGITFTPAVSTDGTLSWSNAKGVTNPAPINIMGPAGKDGEDGKPGANGSDGKNGTTFTPSVSTAGVLSWSNDGGLSNPNPISIKGPTGDQGPKGADGVYQGIKKNSMSAANATTTINPNEVYVFPTMSSLNITLGAATSMFDEYHFFFTSGSTKTALTLPSTVKLPDDFEIEASKTYEISIANNLLLFKGWA